MDQMAARGQSYTELRRELDALGQAKLTTQERATLLEASDALLFDEPAAAARLQEASALLEHLVACERWLAPTAERVRAALEGCGSLVAA